MSGFALAPACRQMTQTKQVGAGMLLMAIAIFMAFATGGCLTVPRPRITGPRQPLDAGTRESRLATFQRYRLHHTKCGLGYCLIRGKERMPYYKLADTLGEFPKSRRLYERIARRDEALSNLLIYGLAFMITAAADHVGPQDLPSSGRSALYGIGGALSLAALAGAIWWDDETGKISEIYNEELSTELGLTTRSAGVSSAPTK